MQLFQRQLCGDQLESRDEATSLSSPVGGSIPYASAYCIPRNLDIDRMRNEDANILTVAVRTFTIAGSKLWVGAHVCNSSGANEVVISRFDERGHPTPVPCTSSIKLTRRKRVSLLLNSFGMVCHCERTSCVSDVSITTENFRGFLTWPAPLAAESKGFLNLLPPRFIHCTSKACLDPNIPMAWALGAGQKCLSNLLRARSFPAAPRRDERVDPTVH